MGLSLSTISLVIIVLALSLALWCLQRRYQCQRAEFQMVLDNMKEGLVVLNSDRTIALMNTTGSRLLEQSWRNLSYDTVEARFEALDLEGNLLPTSLWPSARALRGDFVKDHRLLYRNKITGEMGARIMSTAPVPSSTGGRSGQVIISYRDDTARQRVDEARGRLAAIVESSCDAIVSTDVAGIVTSWNRGAEAIFGYPAAEIIGSHIKRLLPATKSAAEADVIARLRAGETVEPFDTIRLARDGHQIHVNLSLSVLRDSARKITGISAIARDITETRNLERQLLHAQKMEAIGQLTGGIAHDFNNLLAIILGNLELLERDIKVEVATAEEGRRKIAATVDRASTARRAAARAADLTRRMLSFSSKEQLRPEATELNHSVRNALEMATRALGPKIKVTVDLAAIPPVLLDASALENVLLNLAVNARDAMPRGGELLVTSSIVALDGHPSPLAQRNIAAGTYARISVSDTGEGMSPETLERAFEPFFTTKARGEGTGLGLAMVYGFAQQSGGSAHIYSEQGHGTTVSLYLPFAEPGALPPPIATVHAPAAAVPATILLVDDEPDLLTIAAIFLTRLGYTVFEAHDARAAMDLLRAHATIELMITDIIMPGPLNGVELAHEARELRPALRVLYTSGYPADALAQKQFAPVDGSLLHKPYRLVELATTVRSTLDAERVTSKAVSP